MPWPFPRPVSKGSGRGLNRGFGWIPDRLPAGPSLSPSVEHTEKVWWISLLSSHLRVLFWRGDRTLSTFGVQRLSRGFCQGITKHWACGLEASGSITLSPRALSQPITFLDNRSGFPLNSFSSLHFVFPLHPTAFPFFLGSRRKGLTAQGHSLLGTACAETETFPEPVSTPSGEVGRSHWP